MIKNKLIDEELIVSAHQMKSADNYHKWTYDQFKSFIKGDVLEVGCGFGVYTKLISENEKCKTIRTIDIAEKTINEINKENFSDNVSFELIDLMQVEVKFDLVVCMNVLEHIKDDVKFLEKILSLLNKNGVLFHLLPSHKFLYSNFDKEVGHYRRYTKSSFSQVFLKKNYYNLIKQYYFNPIGALGYFFVYKILNKPTFSQDNSEIGIFDKYLVPISRFLFPKKFVFGISLINIIQKND